MPIIDGGNAFTEFGAENTAGTYGAVTKTVGDVFRMIKRTFGDESGVQLEDLDIVAWINDAQMEIVNTNGVLKAKSTIAATVGRTEYKFPDMDIHSIDSIHFNGQRVQNVPFAQVEIARIDMKESVSGGPSFWYEWGGNLHIWPAADTTDNIEVYYTAKPAPVTTNLTSTLSVPDKYFRSVVDYVLARAYEMDEDWNASKSKNDQFAEQLTTMGEEERTAQNMTYSTVTIVDDWM